MREAGNAHSRVTRYWSLVKLRPSQRHHTDELTFRLMKDSFQSVLQRRKVFLYDCPNDVQVNLEVAVEQHVTHTDDLFPGDLGMIGLELLG